MDLERAREKLVSRLEDREGLSARTRDALLTVPRHEFLPDEHRDRAYEDRPLPIGGDQTVSAPHMVAIMVDLLDADAGDRVLEIGTGCGYHAAVVAEIVGAGNVYSVERNRRLAAEARETLAAVGYGDVHVRVGDGHEGWPEHAPYDAAYLTCAAPEFPGPVVDQVRQGGQLLGPIGRRRQELVSARVRPDDLERDRHGGVRFVSMQSGIEGEARD